MIPVYRWNSNYCSLLVALSFQQWNRFTWKDFILLVIKNILYCPEDRNFHFYLLCRRCTHFYGHKIRAVSISILNLFCNFCRRVKNGNSCTCIIKNLVTDRIRFYEVNLLCQCNLKTTTRNNRMQIKFSYSFRILLPVRESNTNCFLILKYFI